ncbi:uncharacterized protein LOC129270313 [Lytechinus pictus]|uniref:uncharacterized protein LOC129270313 n=1 Tax=Lytechinus pictus TaxID=7653 RepID=UPI0030B9E74A
MDFWSLYLLILVSVISLSSSKAQEGRCTKRISRVVFYTETFSKSSSQKYKVKCGFLHLFECTRYRTVYSVGSRRLSRVGYTTGYECCPGWITEGSNCLPTQPPTTKAVTTTATEATTTTTINSNTPTTTIPPSSTTNRNTNNGNTQRHARSRTPTTDSPINSTETSTEFVGGPRGSTSLLSNRSMMMGISVVAVIVFLAMSIGGVFCGVRRLCPKKKPAERSDSELPTSRENEASRMMNGTVPSGSKDVGARPKLKQKMMGQKGKLTAASNPGYDLMDPDNFTQESSYEAIDPEEGPLKPHKYQTDAKGFERVRMSDLTHSRATRLQTSPEKGRRPSAPPAVIDNDYTTFTDEIRTPPEPAPRNPPSDNLKMDESKIEKRKPLPKPKPLPKARRNLQPGSGSLNTSAPPSASNHLSAPSTVTAQYLDMSKGQSPSFANAELSSCEKESASPRKPGIIKFPSFEESRKASVEDCSEGFKTNMPRPSIGNINLYDHVGESRSEPSSRRGSDAKHAFPTQGMYVPPGDLSPAVTKKLTHAAYEKTTCTYVVGDQVPGVPPRSPLFSDSYDLVGINGCNDLGIEHDPVNELSPYDVVVTPENRRKKTKPDIMKSGYAIPRQDSGDLDNYYENHRRSTASLPNSNRKLSLPVQSYGDEEVYDIVEVKDSHSMTTGRPPKVAPKKPTVTTGLESQTTKTAIERSRSGPSLFRSAELDSMYMNTSRF